jgi:hypothetical protein
MALDIVTQDIMLDEATGLQDDDADPSAAPHSTNTTSLQYLLYGSGGLPSQEVFKTNFVQVTASAGETNIPVAAHPLGSVK